MATKNWEELLPKWCLLDGEPWRPGQADFECPPVPELLMMARNWPHEEKPGVLQQILDELCRRWRIGKESEIRANAADVAELCGNCLRQATIHTQSLFDLGGTLLIKLAGTPDLRTAVAHFGFGDIKVVGKWILRTSGGQKMSLVWAPRSTRSAPHARSRRNPVYHR